jgi:hypothetical protein
MRSSYGERSSLLRTWKQFLPQLLVSETNPAIRLVFLQFFVRTNAGIKSLRHMLVGAVESETSPPDGDRCVTDVDVSG